VNIKNDAAIFETRRFFVLFGINVKKRDHELFSLKEEITAPDETGVMRMHKFCQFPSDYFEILEIGFAKAC
jgi:hypothetical protein